jgi:thymidylate synthase
MANLILRTGLAEAWLAVMEHLMEQPRQEDFNLIVGVKPGPEGVKIRNILNSFLENHKLQRVETVANTIFPLTLSLITGGRHELYQRYKALLPHLRRFRSNNRGTYFERMISWDGDWDAKVNQIETIVRKLQHPTSGRCVYEISVYDPRVDSNFPRMMGFPCLSHVSLKLDRLSDTLHLVALYRNHYYFERAYGNLVGLSALQRFIAAEAKLRPGELVCHSTHAEIDCLSKREATDLIARCKAVAHDDEGPKA